MLRLQLEPVDTLFFRDGTPFASGSASQAEVGGLFPPYPGTLVGALRAVLARRNGWDGRGRWPHVLDDVLGDGPDDVGALEMTGPFVVRGGAPLYPMPRHVLGSTEDRGWRPRVMLHPGDPTTCDLGEEVRLPQPVSALPPEVDPADLAPAERSWVTSTGLGQVLAGELPGGSEIVPSSDLWSDESRVGLARDRTTRTAEQGKLYSSRHTRLRDGVGIGVRLDGVPSEWTSPVGSALTLGGEGRAATCAEWPGEVHVEMPLERIVAEGRMVLVTLTPLDLDDDVCLGRRPIEGLGGARVVSGCTDRPERIGGWDSLNRKPLPQRSLVPAGSVFFCEFDDASALREAIGTSDVCPRVGARRSWGFGMVALGSWPDEKEAQ